ncbi:TolC family outer membrane protein [Aurantivibrio infirmus]
MMISAIPSVKKTLYAIGTSCLFVISPLSSADSLLEIYQKALENDPQLKADKANYDAGMENKKIGLAGLLPSISGSVEHGRSDQESDGQTFAGGIPVGGGGRSKTDTLSTNYSVSLTQPLFDMGAWYSFQRGGVQSESAEVQFEADQQSFIIRVADAYFNVLRAIDGLETATAEQRANESQLEQAKQRFEVGLTPITDVHDAQAAFDGARATTLDARGQVGIAYEALEVLTGSAEDAVLPLSGDFPVTNPTPASRSDWVDFALENNYALKSAKLNAETSRLNAKVSASRHLPTLGLSATYSDRDSENDRTAYATNPPSSSKSTSDSTSETTSIGVRLSIPIYSGGGTSAQRRQAYDQYLRAQELYNLQQRNTIQSARSLHLSVETSVATVNARQQQIISSTSALEATQAGYDAGTRTLVDVLLAQRTLYQAQRAYSDALYNYILNTLRLKEAAGNLSPEDIIELDRALDAANPATRSSFEQ